MLIFLSLYFYTQLLVSCKPSAFWTLLWLQPLAPHHCPWGDEAVWVSWHHSSLHVGRLWFQIPLLQPGLINRHWHSITVQCPARSEMSFSWNVKPKPCLFFQEDLYKSYAVILRKSGGFFSWPKCVCHSKLLWHCCLWEVVGYGLAVALTVLAATVICNRNAGI